MTLFPRVVYRLLAIAGVTLVGFMPLAHAFSAQAAELEGTVVPIDSPAVHASSYSQASAAPAPLPAEAAPSSAAPPVAPEPPHHPQHGDWERELEAGLKGAFGGHRENDYEDAIQTAVLIPLFAVIFIFGGPIFLICYLISKRYHYRQLRQQNINNNIDKLLAAGRDIPVELLRGDEPKGADDNGNRSKGIRNICLGAGWFLFLTIMVGFDIGSLAFIWIALGVSQVLIWYLNQPKAGQPLAPQVEQQD